jgi:hypothetical protein
MLLKIGGWIFATEFIALMRRDQRMTRVPRTSGVERDYALGYKLL